MTNNTRNYPEQQPDPSTMSPEELAEYLARLAEEGGEFQLPPEAATAGDQRNPRRRDRNRQAPEVGTLVQTSVRDELDLLVMHEDAKADLLAGLRAIELRPELERIWSINEVEPQAGRCILNFYGKPGTGKTRAALAVARRIGKPLYKVDYAAVISKYLGDTAKHISLAFKQAAEANAVLFFDEADSLLSKRVDTSESCSTSINQNRNVLMQCLDAFSGVVIMTTNLFQNYDEALLRRIAKHINFKLPNRIMRKRLFEIHLPNRQRVEVDLMAVAKESIGLSGGDIKNVCLNSIYAGSVDDNTDNWKITQAIIVNEIGKVKTTKDQHCKKKTVSTKPIGFAAPAELEEES